MKTMKALEFGILNVKMHPHNPEKYYRMMEMLFGLRCLAKIRGDDWGAPFFIEKISSNAPLDGLYGTFVRFLQIDPQKAWIDIKKLKPILDKDGRPIPQVDNDLKPNMREIEFVFYPKAHMLFFNSAMISPSMAQKLLTRLCASRVIEKEYGVIDISNSRPPRNPCKHEVL